MNSGLNYVPIYVLVVSSALFLPLLAAEDSKDDVYIVYLGQASPTNASLRQEHAQLLTSLLKRKRNALVRRYGYGFSGFAARLSAEEASSMASKPGVVSVFRDPLLQLHTTRSWDFLKYQTDVVLKYSRPAANTAPDDSAADTIIGILDTGIWPESLSFSDKDMGPIPSRWKGVCMAGKDFNSSNCNRKLIGARYYGSPQDSSSLDDLTVRDSMGHGTHVSSTAAGSPVPDSSYYGLASGTAIGGSPGARLAMYRVCSDEGCRGSNILAAYDDAIADGVDVLSLSLGAPSFVMVELKDDPIAIGAFHAVEHGITVVCSAGNDGPDAGTVVNAAPWLLTVAASTIDRDFESDVVLGGSKVIKGGAIHFGDLGKSPVHPIIYGKSAKISDDKENDARNCIPGSMKKEMINGKIVVCGNDDAEYSPIGKQQVVRSLGGIGLVLIDDKLRTFATSFGTFPVAAVTSNEATGLLSYINSTSNPVATILPTETVTQYKPAPIIADFSARGPSSISRNILKPDIAAPGVNILAAWIANDTEDAVQGKDPPLFNIISGTSMACPHVSGVAATVKSRNPAWSPSAIRSAIMTTAIQSNNIKSPITTEKNSVATPYDFGAGELSTTGPLQPGLVYETTSVDYLNFLCHYGYNTTTIKIIAKAIPEDFSCPKETNPDFISDINYPSIAISNIKQSRKVNRTVTNVGGDGQTVYTVSIEAPASVDVQVVPEKLEFNSAGQRLSYQVVFTPKQQIKDYVFGAITWSNGKFKVRSALVVST